MSKDTPKHDAVKPLAQDGTAGISTQITLSVLHFGNRRCTKQTASRAFLLIADQWSSRASLVAATLAPAAELSIELDGQAPSFVGRMPAS